MDTPNYVLKANEAVSVPKHETKEPSLFKKITWRSLVGLIVYREKRYYNRKVTRQEYNKFFYSDTSKIEYRTANNRINIKGTVESIWYDYNKDGTLPEEPTYHRTVTEGLVYFYTTESPEVDFVSEIEEHTPIRISFVEK